MLPAILLAASIGAVPGPDGPGAKAPRPGHRAIHEFGGGPLPGPRDADDGCVPPALQARIQAALAEYLRASPPDPMRATPPRYPFFPLAGTLNGDIFTGGYVDLDPAPNSINDFHCMPFAPYDDHAGTDCGVRSWNEVIIGMPVFSPLDGTVAYSQDGYPDMNTSGAVDDGNYIIIDHGGGRFGWYFHLKRNSVAFTTGQHVNAGQQIGLAASSGHSFGPHLHFQTMDQNNTVVFEPWAGACRPGPSGFVSQPPTNDSPILLDGGTTYADLSNPIYYYPNAPLLSGQIALADQYITLWALLATQPLNMSWREKIIRPDSVVAIDGGPYNWGNPAIWRQSSIFVYWYTPAIPGWDAQHLGTWHYVLEINGQQVVSAPFELRTARDSAFNRPPQPFTTVVEPAAPNVANVIFCRVQTDPVVDDLDYDTLSWHYVWTVNGATVRDITSAAHSDAIPRNTAAPGSIVRCVVTASDGRASAVPVSRSVLVVNVCAADWDSNALIQPADVAAFVNAWFTAITTGALGGDFDRDGAVTPADVALFVSTWFAALSGGC